VRTQLLELTGAVPARSANRVQPNQSVRFNADGRAFTGKVARVSPTIDPASRSVAVYIQIPNGDGSLKGGTFASGRIVSKVAQDVLIVPTSAIKQAVDTGEPYVNKIVGDMLERAPVQLGLIDEGRGVAEVVSGLEDGDRIVTGTVSSVARSAKVTIIGGEKGRGGQQQRGNGSGAPKPLPGVRQ
jgi:membrane fusion protein, multidrug efflux system